MYKYHEQFYWGYDSMYILINIVLETIPPCF